MKVYINEQEIVIFAGACIKDAVIAYSVESWKRLKSTKMVVLDRFGNMTDPDGPMMDGQKFTLIEI
ncbi:MAG: hypothetical protein HXX13_04900 [Bacteroidetes bacterium]|nr:hypothetical protein [Bacteroidota bacterium]